MLRRIKYEMNMNISQLAEFLNVSPPTIHSWEKKETWPQWALKKCGILDEY